MRGSASDGRDVQGAEDGPDNAMGDASSAASGSCEAAPAPQNASCAAKVPQGDQRPDAISTADRKRLTELAVAAMKGQSDTVMALLKAGVNAKTAEQPLLCLALGAGMNSKSDITERAFGLDRGCDPSTDGVPVVFGDSEARANVARQLIAAGASVKLKSAAGVTPLALAAVSGQREIVSLLLEMDSSVKESTKMGIFALFAAAAGGHEEVVKVLLESAAYTINWRDKEDHSPLHIAVMRRHRAVVSLLLAQNDSVDVPINRNAVDTAGKTPLYWATALRHEGITQDLVARGADLELAAELADNFTPLMNAIQGNMELKTIKQLVSSPFKGRQLQTNVHAKSKAGITALHLAARYGNQAVVELLLDCGADPLAESDSHLLPIDMLPPDGDTSISAVDPGSKGEGPTAAGGAAADVAKLRGILERAVGAAELLEGSGLKDILQGISIVAVLLVTVTFVGVLNPPGGPTPDSGYIRLEEESNVLGTVNVPHRAAMKAYFVLNALSLYWAATDLLLVLVFLLPGNTRRFGRGLDQARWVWTIIVSCSLCLAIAIIAAVAAFAAAAFAVLPKHQYALAAVPFGVGMCSVGGVLVWLLRSTWASKPTKMWDFLARSEPLWLSSCRRPIVNGVFGAWRQCCEERAHFLNEVTLTAQHGADTEAALGPVGSTYKLREPRQGAQATASPAG